MINGENSITITSRQNPRVQYLKSLQQKKHREQEKKFLIEGWRFVEEALCAGLLPSPASGELVEMVIFGASAKDDVRCTRLSAIAVERGISVLYMADHVFAAIVETEQPQGVAALVRQWEPHVADVLRQNENPLLLVVDGVRDPGNLGTVIRTADAAGVTAVILLNGAVDLYNGKTLRSTMGSIFHLPVLKDMTAAELKALLAEFSLPLLAADVSADSESAYAIPMSGPLAIAVGSEAAGVSAELKTAARLVNIPMPGRAESLNVSVAAGILLFEAVRQRTVSTIQTCK